MTPVRASSSPVSIARCCQAFRRRPRAPPSAAQAAALAQFNDLSNPHSRRNRVSAESRRWAGWETLTLTQEAALSAVAVRFNDLLLGLPPGLGKLTTAVGVGRTIGTGAVVAVPTVMLIRSHQQQLAKLPGVRVHILTVPPEGDIGGWSGQTRSACQALKESTMPAPGNPVTVFDVFLATPECLGNPRTISEFLKRQSTHGIRLLNVDEGQTDGMWDSFRGDAFAG